MHVTGPLGSRGRRARRQTRTRIGISREEDNMHDGALMAYFLALLIGCVAGLRTVTAPAAVSWAAHLGRLHLDATWLAFLGYAWTPWILSLLALGELVGDQLPSTPSRTRPFGLAPASLREASPALRSVPLVARWSAECSRVSRARSSVPSQDTASGPDWPPPSTRIARPPPSRTRSRSEAPSQLRWRCDEKLRPNHRP